VRNLVVRQNGCGVEGDGLNLMSVLGLCKMGLGSVKVGKRVGGRRSHLLVVHFHISSNFSLGKLVLDLFHFLSNLSLPDLLLAHHLKLNSAHSSNHASTSLWGRSRWLTGFTSTMAFRIVFVAKGHLGSVVLLIVTKKIVERWETESTAREVATELGLELRKIGGGMVRRRVERKRRGTCHYDANSNVSK
jgi:hypothetical protein